MRNYLDVFEDVGDSRRATRHPSNGREPQGAEMGNVALALGNPAAARIFSRLLGVELWIAADENALADLHREAVTLPVILADEAKILAGMAEADARAVLETLVRIQPLIPGARLRSLIPPANGNG